MAIAHRLKKIRNRADSQEKDPISHYKSKKQKSVPKTVISTPTEKQDRHAGDAESKLKEKETPTSPSKSRKSRKSARKTRRPNEWTDNDVTALIAAVKRGERTKTIVALLGRNSGAVQNKIRRLRQADGFKAVLNAEGHSLVNDEP